MPVIKAEVEFASLVVEAEESSCEEHAAAGSVHGHGIGISIKTKRRAEAGFRDGAGLVVIYKHLEEQALCSRPAATGSCR